ncbi:hypothetical protein NE236_26945 [Actinoallomurus purpureus]|uniref:hypothetical protein n=1 Tax=Actinoallomurus purpureus TaxID=478114 RepID=UPI00209272AD|nr:hypothetical protein [Actinoallomurus purpureus]MCO6008616.1 hypothetical protein [Actinoallomurus purpureus]
MIKSGGTCKGGPGAGRRRRCALIRHHGGQATIRLLAEVSAGYATIQCRAADALGISPDEVAVVSQGTAPLLHSVKLARGLTD